MLGYGAEAEEKKRKLEELPSLTISLGLSGSLFLSSGSMGAAITQNASNENKVKLFSEGNIGLYTIGAGINFSIGMQSKKNSTINNQTLNLSIFGFGGSITISEKGIVGLTLDLSLGTGNKGQNSEMGIGYTVYSKERYNEK